MYISYVADKKSVVFDILLKLCGGNLLELQGDLVDQDMRQIASYLVDSYLSSSSCILIIRNIS